MLSRLLKSIITIFFCCVCVVLPAHSNELPAGTVIKASNINGLLLQTFEGKTIASMIPEKIEWMIKEHGLTIILRHFEEIPIDPRRIEATRKYSANVTFDPETRMVSGYRAGLPFPDVSSDDPHAATKLIWNLYLTGGTLSQNFLYIPKFTYLMIDGDKGIERSMKWIHMRIWMTGRLGGEPVLSDGSIQYKYVNCGYHPYDIRGAGSFTIRYMDGRMDDMWAYVRTARRTRRLLGGNWMDPIGGTDQLNDEMSVFSAFPTWYPKYTLLGKRTILAVAHSRGKAWDEDNKDNPFPNLDLKNPPYWNPINEWEPREVWVIEAEMPEEHPYSKRIYYFDAKTWVPYIGECYDKKGEFFKILLNDTLPLKGDDTEHSWGSIAVGGCTIDFKRRHATVFFQSEDTRRNPPGMKEHHVTLGVMEAIAQGRWKPPF